MKGAAIKTRQNERRPTVTATTLRLRYTLAELPSAQHRAGLAGLVLMVQWLGRQPKKRNTVCHVVELADGHAAFEFDEAGLERLFDAVYAASTEVQFFGQQRKNPRTRAVEKPVKVREETITDDKGKTRKKTSYGYEVTVPRGAFLLDWDPGREGTNGPWAKLWRDMLWAIFRGVPATRRPYELRAAREQANDAADAWKRLSGDPDRAVELPSTYFISAQDVTAENVPFRDRARFQFLLHFGPFVAGVYVPQVIDVRGIGAAARAFVGYALAVPDVAALQVFCEEFPAMLQGRATAMSGYRPREAVVDLPVESALDMARRLAERLAVRTGDVAAGDLVLGYDVFHMAKIGNNVTILASLRVEPTRQMVDAYAHRRGAYWDPLFRRTRLANLVAQRAWYVGYDALVATTPCKTQTIGSRYFRRDAREAFRLEATHGGPMSDDTATNRSTEELVYHLVQSYVRRRVKARTGLEWKAVKEAGQDDARRREFTEKKEATARNAFLAVRSRTGVDFVDWFTGTICSVPQRLRQSEFLALSRVLRDDPATVRTLTLLALSAAS